MGSVGQFIESPEMCHLTFQVDQQSNQVRRLQRNNDELQQQVDNLRVQVDHLQTRYSMF